MFNQSPGLSNRLIVNDYGRGRGEGEGRRVCKRRGLYRRGLNSPNRKRTLKKTTDSSADQMLSIY